MGYMLIWAKIAEVGYYLCGVFLPAGMRVWIVYTNTRTRIPDGYKNSSNNVTAGAKCLPYPPPYRVKPVGYSLTSWPRGEPENPHFYIKITADLHARRSSLEPSVDTNLQRRWT